MTAESCPSVSGKPQKRQSAPTTWLRHSSGTASPTESCCVLHTGNVAGRGPTTKSPIVGPRQHAQVASPGAGVRGHVWGVFRSLTVVASFVPMAAELFTDRLHLRWWRASDAEAHRELWTGSPVRRRIDADGRPTVRPAGPAIRGCRVGLTTYASSVATTAASSGTADSSSARPASRSQRSPMSCEAHPWQRV